MESADLIVMKFGGSSLATVASRRTAADRVAAAVHRQERLVVVVSAMGRAGDPYATDTLLGLLRAFPQASAREVDALAAAGEEISAAVFAAELQERGLPAVSLRGFQAGIITDERHREAVIREIRPARIRDALTVGQVVVVAGFQGITAAGEVTTLGRGGSDTTAMVLGEALSAERVEIYTDVEGVHSADPRVVRCARAMAEVTYEESAELARKGAEILHPHAAQRARAAGLPVVIRSLSDHASVTWLVPDEGRWSVDGALAPRTTAVTSTREIAQVTVSGAPFGRDPKLLEAVFRRIAQDGISLDMMSIFPDRVAFTLPRDRVAEAVEQVARSDLSAVVNDRCAKVTLVGGGIHGIPGIMHLVVRALAERGIAILQSVDSNMMISVLVERDRELDAVRALHAEFFE